MGRRARERICERFTLDAMADRMEHLFESARQLHRSQAREPVGQGVASICATQVVEYLRLLELADQLWAERQNRSDQAVQPLGSQGSPKRRHPRWLTDLKAKLVVLSRDQTRSPVNSDPVSK